MKKISWLVSLIGFFISVGYAANPVINLVVEYKTVYFAGKAKKAMAINNQIPGPTLHFKQGDRVTIHVFNHLDKGTAIHWHGLLVPWQMDGVEHLSQKAIPPGGSFRYQFTLEQSGTYWYHAHAGLQEQQGLYGAFLIDPLTPPAYHYQKDFVVVLSDWSNTKPEQILANLKKDGNYYGPRFPLQPSLTKFFHDYRKASKDEREKIVDDYTMMQQMRMSIYDMSDVAFDAFLLNGHSTENPWTARVKVGDVVRLRFIGASGSTSYRVKIDDTTLQMVHVQGNDVIPYSATDFTIAPGETYDVLVKIQKNKPYIIYAESRDTVGSVYGALRTGNQQIVDDKQLKPFPEPLPVTRDMMALMMGAMNQGVLPQTEATTMMQHAGHTEMSHAEMGHMSSLSHGAMSHTMIMPIEPTRLGDTIEPSDPMYRTSLRTSYQPIRAARSTNEPNKPITGVIHMELFGYMDRFIWFINGVPEYKAHPIPLEPGQRYRIIFKNTSMMFHPMHIHGHWFILRKGDGAFDPLLHTINVPPGATITADLDTDASGQWFFHCHLLYHMMSGMARPFQYVTLVDITKGEAKPENIVHQTDHHNRPIVRVDAVRPIDASLVKHAMGHSPGFWWATFLDVGADPFHHAQRLSYKGLYGPDYHKLELFINDAELYKGSVENADMDLFYWQLISQFWAIKGGVNYFNQPARTPYWQFGIGLEGLMPGYIDTDLRSYYYRGSAKLDMEFARDTQITNNFFIRAGVRSILASKTVMEAELGKGLNQMRYLVRPYYRLAPGLNVFFEYEHEQDYGTFKRIQMKEGSPTVLDTTTFGVMALF